MKTSLLYLCLIATAIAGAHADTLRTLPVCPPDLPDMPRPIRPCMPLPPTADPWDQVVFNDRDDGCFRHHHHHHCHRWCDLTVNGQDDGCVKRPGKPTSTSLLPACFQPKSPSSLPIMKTSFHLALLLLVTLNVPLSARDSDDKLDAAKQVVERISEAQPPRETGSGRTPEQAIKDYKESGPASSYHLEIHPVPPPAL